MANTVILTLARKQLAITIKHEENIKTSTGWRESWRLTIILRESKQADQLIFSDVFDTQSQASNYLFQWLYCNQ